MFVSLLLFAAAINDLTPRIGRIEVYGARKIPATRIRSALGAQPGDFLPARLDAEERIDKVSGVIGSRVEASCCDGHNLVLYVGVEERDGPRMEYHETPTGDITLPRSLFDSYRNLLDEVSGSIRGHNNDEDLTAGYSLMQDPTSRSLQQAFLPAVAADLPTIDRVVREAADPEQRAAAAYLLQYAPRGPRTTPIFINGLQYALRDTDDTVRENAVRSLKAVAVGAKLHPDQEIKLEPTWFVELMNSVVWSDRRDASETLVNITEDRNAAALTLLRDRALPSVLEMARWHDLRYALPAFILAGRLAGLDDAAIRNAWSSGDVEAVLKQAADANPASRSHFFLRHK